MRDSGVEWIGRVPSEWQVARIRHLSTVRRGASPRPIDDPVYFDDDGAYAWVRISDVTAAGRYLYKTEQMLSELGADKSIRLDPGELFVSIAATVGKPIITRIKCCIHDGFVYFDDLRLNREFLYYVLASGLPYGGLGKLGTQLNLNTDTIGDIAVPVPSVDEQVGIVEFLESELARRDRTARALAGQINLLREHRQALITAAVTGELDVAAHAA
jgi:type I restriction enzyme S subunit